MATKKTKKAAKAAKAKVVKDESITGARTNVHGAGRNGKNGTAPVRGSSTAFAPATPIAKKVLSQLGDADTMVTRRAEDGSVRIKWFGHSIVSIIRWMGHHDASKAEADAWLKALGYTISPVTINAQVTSGRHGKKNHQPGGFRGELPELEPAQEKYLLSIRPK